MKIKEVLFLGVTDVLKGIWLTMRDIIPISVLLIIFQVFVLKAPIDNLKTLIAGLVFCTVGLYLFIQGLKFGLMPLGNSVGANLILLNNKALVVAFAFVLGYATTLAEPAIASLAMEIEEISVGAMRNRVLVHTIALGVGIGMALGILKIIYKIPLNYIIFPLVIIMGVLSFAAPKNILGVAFDSGGVTTGPVTVPLNMALAIGLSKVISGSDPLIDGFGIIGLASICPIITVMILGIIIKF